MLTNLYPMAITDLGFRFKRNLSLNQLSSKNMGLALLEHGICPYEFYAATGDLDVKISGFGYATPAILARYKYAPWTLSQMKLTLAPEIKVMSFEEVCAHFDAHPRMVQLIFNKHRSLKRSLPVSRAFNISELARFLLGMSTKAARIISKLNSSPYFLGYMDNRAMFHGRPTETTAKSKLITGMISDYITDTTATLYSLIGNLLYTTMDLMTQPSLTTLKNASLLRQPYTGIQYSRDSWSSIRSRGYVSSRSETLLKDIVSTILCVITKLDQLSFVGAHMIPHAADEIESPSGDNILTEKHLLMYNLAAAKISELSPELGSIAKEMYEFFFADTELAKALASKDLTPTTPMSSLSDLMSYYYNMGEASTLSGLTYHVHSASIFHESVTTEYLFRYFNVNSSSILNLCDITHEQQLSIYGSIDTIGAYYGHIGMSTSTRVRLNTRYRLENFIYDLNQNPTPTPILGKLSAEIWKLSLASNLPTYAQAHMIMLASLLTSFWDVGSADGARSVKMRSLRSIFTPNDANSHWMTALDSIPDAQERQIQNDFLRDLINGVAFIPPANKSWANTTHNTPNGTGGIYVKDYSSVDTARNFKPVTIGRKKLTRRRKS